MKGRKATAIKRWGIEDTLKKQKNQGKKRSKPYHGKKKMEKGDATIRQMTETAKGLENVTGNRGGGLRGFGRRHIHTEEKRAKTQQEGSAKKRVDQLKHKHNEW